MIKPRRWSGAGEKSFGSFLQKRTHFPCFLRSISLDLNKRVLLCCEFKCRHLDRVQLRGRAAARKSIHLAYALAGSGKTGAGARKEIGKRVGRRRQVAADDG